MNRALFATAEWLSRPPGFWVMLLAMVACSVAALAGVSYNALTFLLSVMAIVITSVVLLQGSRDTGAIQAKLDELILAQKDARNELVGLEKREPEEIAHEIEAIEEKAGR